MARFVMRSGDSVNFEGYLKTYRYFHLVLVHSHQGQPSEKPVDLEVYVRPRKLY